MSRALNFGLLGVSLASGAVVQYFKQPQDGKKRSLILTEESAKKIANTLCKMRGAPLKLGQALR